MPVCVPRKPLVESVVASHENLRTAITHDTSHTSYNHLTRVFSALDPTATASEAMSRRRTPPRRK